MHFRKPIIGVTLSQTLPHAEKRWPSRYEFDWCNKAYHYAIEKSGGLPIGLFNTADNKRIPEYLEMVDGVLFTGGADLRSKYYGQKQHQTTSPSGLERDGFEIRLMGAILKTKKPVFCICRGHQVLNTHLKGTLYQDLSLFPAATLAHADSGQTAKVFHDVDLIKDSLLYEIIGKSRITVNSSHHQFVKDLGKGLRAAAVAPDGVLEGMELEKHPFLISVQWHPERIWDNAHSRKLFRAFIAQATNSK
jgi:putative glutamine amidotransferase